MNSIKTELDEVKLLCGAPIYFQDICYIFPPTIRDIGNISYSKFKEYLFVFIADPKTAYDIKDQVDPFYFILIMCETNPKFYRLIKEAFKFFTHEDIIIMKEFNGIQVGNNIGKDKLITRDNFPEFQYILKKLHCYDCEDKYTEPENERARKIIEKLKKSQDIVSQVKSKRNEDSDEVDLPSLISSLGLYYRDLSKVLDLSYYAFFDQVKRMQIKEEYDTNLKSALAGAKIPKNKMKYWIRKIHQTDKGGN